MIWKGCNECLCILFQFWVIYGIMFTIDYSGGKSESNTNNESHPKRTSKSQKRRKSSIISMLWRNDGDYEKTPGW